MHSIGLARNDCCHECGQTIIHPPCTENVVRIDLVTESHNHPGFLRRAWLHISSFPYIAHSRGWSHEEMACNEEIVRNSKELVEGAAMLAKRCLDLAAHLIARDEAPTSIERGGRKAHAMRL